MLDLMTSHALYLQSLNILAGEGSTAITSTPRGAKLKVNTHTNKPMIAAFSLYSQCLDAVPLTVYANGIVMFQGPFRPFTDPATQVHCPLIVLFCQASFPPSSSLFKTFRMDISLQSCSLSILKGFPFNSVTREKSLLFHGVLVRFSLVVAKY